MLSRTAVNHFFRVALMCLGCAAMLFACTTDARASDASYAQSVNADQPLLYAQFEAPAHQNHITTIERLGQACALDGQTAVKLGEVELPETPAGLTLEWWQYTLNQNTADRRIITIHQDGTPLYTVSQRYSPEQADKKDARPQWVFETPSTGKHPRAVSRTLIQPMRWYHAAIVYEPGAATARFYINGLPAGDPQPLDPPNPINTGPATVTVQIGAEGTRGFHGLLDEVALYPGALTGERILAHYRAALPGMKGADMAQIVAHRGNHRYAPENTAVSYKQALEAGAPILELDLNLTSDGVVILMHDSTLDRTTSGSGKVNEHTLEQVRKLDAGSWKHERYKDEPVPTFEEIAQLCKGRATMMLDLKADVKGDAIAGVIQRVGIEPDRVIVAPWQIDRADDIKPHLPGTPMILLHSEPPDGYDGTDKIFDQLKARGFSGFSINWKNLTQDFVNAAHRNGMKVHTWTINDPEEISGAALMGVDGIITDIPAEAAAVLSKIRD